MAGLEMRFQALADPERDTSPAARRRRLLTWVAAGGVTVGGLLLALILGTFGYELRRSSAHESRLRGILVQEPTVYQVTVGLEEKAPLVAIVDVDSKESLASAIDRWGGGKAEEIRERAGEWAQLRVFDAGDMIYFIFFDAGDVMRDFVYVSKGKKGGAGE